MYIILSILGIFIICVFFLSIWFVDSKMKLQKQLANLESIQSQLLEVAHLEEIDSYSRQDAFHFCKAVENSTIASYNDFVGKPRHFIPAKFFGYPTRFTRRYC